jgi:hypothetical protein
MTYGELLAELNKLNSEQLNQTVSVYGNEGQEVFGVSELLFSSDLDIDDVLDVGHPVLVYLEG